MAQRTAKVIVWSANSQQWVSAAFAVGGELTAAEFAQVSPDNIRQLGKEQISSLSYACVAALSPTQIPLLRAIQVPFFTLAQIPYIPVPVIAEMTNTQKLGFTWAQVMAMTITQKQAYNLPDPPEPYAGGGTQGPNSNNEGSTDLPI